MLDMKFISEIYLDGFGASFVFHKTFNRFEKVLSESCHITTIFNGMELKQILKCCCGKLTVNDEPGFSRSILECVTLCGIWHH